MRDTLEPYVWGDISPSPGTRSHEYTPQGIGSHERCGHTSLGDYMLLTASTSLGRHNTMPKARLARAPPVCHCSFPINTRNRTDACVWENTGTQVCVCGITRWGHSGIASHAHSTLFPASSQHMVCCRRLSLLSSETCLSVVGEKEVRD